jgi:NADH-quinone oxidoreductase subunit G
MSTELIKVTINGQEFEVEKGARLIDVCNEKASHVPSFCYYSDLELQASCRMCLVRIEKMPKLQTSCTITCTDGMTVTTESDEIEKARRAMSEFLLANHPLDCPVCDRGGECELQEMVMVSGGLEERFSEKKNAYPETYLSPIVANDQQRCILCKRCTRVCSEWMGEDAIEAGNRGVDTVIGTYGGWLNCSQCGNCIEVCPTGTLLDGTYRHNTRPWELKQTITTCTYCSDGCQMSVGSRNNEVLRVVARDRYVNGLNGEFLCIKGRFAHNFVNSKERIKTPLIRYKKGGKLIPSTWDEAVSHIAEKFKEAGSVSIIASPRLTNESIFAFKKFAIEVVKTDNYAISDSRDMSAFIANMSGRLCTHKEIRHAKTILLIGGEPEENQPLTAKQIRQAVKNGGAKLIVVNEKPIRLTKSAAQFVHINSRSLDTFVLALADKNAQADAAKKMGVDVKEIDAVREMVNATEGDIIILLGAELSPAAQTVAAQFAHGHENQNVMFHPLPLHNNSVGAIDMMPGAKSVAAVAGAAKALYIGGSLPDASVLAGKDFVVVQELFETETTAHADVVLPAASFAEVDGTYTNNDGFVQRIRQTIEPLNQSKADWMAVSLIAREMGVDFGWQMSASAVFKELADTNTAYAGLRFPALKDESQPVQVKHAIHGKKDLSAELKSLHEKVAALPEGEKSHDTPPIGHILHKPGTMTGKTEQFHLLANGNPKPDDRLVSPLYSFNLDGTPREEKEVAAAI